MRFYKGHMMYWKSTGKPAYQKMGDDDFDWWLALDSYFVTESKELNPLTNKMETVFTRRPESEKPLYKKDTQGNDTPELNRLAFRWTDQQTYDWYKGIMTFD